MTDELDAQDMTQIGASRRGFLKIAGASGAALYVFGLSACKSGAKGGKMIKLGFVTPRTGPLAPFAAPDDFVIAQLKPLFDKGVTIAGTTYPVAIAVRDSQSDPKRAAEVAQELIDSEGVDLLLAAGTADTTNPTADQAEAAGVPCITTDAPWQAWFFGRHGDPKQPFEWTYHFFWGLDQISNVYVGMWQQAPVSKMVGGLWSNDPDGSAIRTGVGGAIGKAGGFKYVDAGLFPPGTSDFSAQIAKFKQESVEIVTGLFIPPDFTTFWTQCAQQDFHPKVVTVAKALLFPETVKSLGARGIGLSSEVWWSSHHPFTSSLSKTGAQSLCRAYTKATGKPASPPLGFKHALFEVAINVLGRTTERSPEAIRDAIRATKMTTIAGPVSWTNGPNANVSQTPLVGGQWIEGSGFGVEEAIVFNAQAPEIPLTGKLRLLS